MNYLFIAFPFIVWLISQTIKFVIRLARKDTPVHLRGLFWVFVWGGGVPSTHTAILTSSLILVWHQFGPSPILIFCIVITMLWLYDMATHRKRQELLDHYFINDESASLKKIVHDGYLLDLAGHTVSEIFWGAVLGIILGIGAAYAL